MEPRRRIIIPTGVDPEETHVRPFFDSEATQSARRVVPLTEALPGSSTSAPGRRRWPLVALFVMVAVGTGLAVGLGMSAYQSRQSTEKPLTVQPVKNRTVSALSWTHTPEEEEEEEVLVEEDSTALVTDTEQAVGPPAEVVAPDPPPASAEAPKEKKDRKPAVDERAPKRDPVVEPADGPAEEGRDQRTLNRGPRRERNERNSIEDLPQDPITRRTRDEVHRIREIFEGIP